MPYQVAANEIKPVWWLDCKEHFNWFWSFIYHFIRQWGILDMISLGSGLMFGLSFIGCGFDSCLAWFQNLSVFIAGIIVLLMLIWLCQVFNLKCLWQHANSQPQLGVHQPTISINRLGTAFIKLHFWNILTII